MNRTVGIVVAIAAVAASAAIGSVLTVQFANALTVNSNGAVGGAAQANGFGCAGGPGGSGGGSLGGASQANGGSIAAGTGGTSTC